MAVRRPASAEPISISPAEIEEHVRSAAIRRNADDDTADAVAYDVRETLRDLAAVEVGPWPAHHRPPSPPTPLELPLDALPKVLAAWVRSVSRSVQVPQDLPYGLALAAVSAAVAGKVVVRVDAAWDREWVTLYLALVGVPGERKSPAVRHMVAPIRAWERERAAEELPRRELAMHEVEIAEHRLAAAKKAVGRGKGSLDEVEAEQLALRDAVAGVPRVTQLLAQDSTPEALVAQMAEQGGRVAVISPEGGPLQILDGRYSDGAARLEELCHAYDGEEIRTRRVTRETQSVADPALTLAVALQPSVLDSIRNGRSMRGQGFLGRVAWIRPESRVGSRVDSAEAPGLDRRAEARYGSVIRRLLDWEPDPDPDGSRPPAVITMTPAAAAEKAAYHAEVEPALAPGGELHPIADWATKTVGRAVRIAAILELVSRADAGQSPSGAVISGPSMEAAVSISRALTTHARAVYGDLEVDGRTADLRYLLARLHELGPGITETELRAATRGRTSIGGADELAELVDDLEARGCLRRVPNPDWEGRGRRSSPLLELRPLTLHSHTGNTGNGVGAAPGGTP